MDLKSSVCILLLLILFSSSAAVVSADDSSSITVTDLAGRNVEIPATVDKVASLIGPGTEKIFLVGGIDKLALVPPIYKKESWATKLIPGLQNLPSEDMDNPNIEELLKQNIDVVFFSYNQKSLEKLADANIPAVVSLFMTADTEPQSIDEFTDNFKDTVSLYGDVLGPESQKKAEDFNQYFDEKVQNILNVTANIPDGEKPTVYYIRGPDTLTTHGKNTNTYWLVTMAGGKMVSGDLDDMIPKVNIEQVMDWNPDIIIMGRVNSTSPVMDDPQWKDIAAVKNGKVYTNPDGVMSWDYSSEGVLLLEYLAKLFYPDKFADIDMISEIKDFYSRFYDYSLTDDEANRILTHMPPA